MIEEANPDIEEKVREFYDGLERMRNRLRVNRSDLLALAKSFPEELREKALEDYNAACPSIETRKNEQRVIRVRKSHKLDSAQTSFSVRDVVKGELDKSSIYETLRQYQCKFDEDDPRIARAAENIEYLASGSDSLEVRRKIRSETLRKIAAVEDRGTKMILSTLFWKVYEEAK